LRASTPFASTHDVRQDHAEDEQHAGSEHERVGAVAFHQLPGKERAGDRARDIRPTIANNRLPCCTVYTSFANAQSWAMTIKLKIPTQMKNATPIGTPVRLRAKNAMRQATKNSVTLLMSLTRDTREANEL
jgi:hypothetical protein